MASYQEQRTNKDNDAKQRNAVEGDDQDAEVLFILKSGSDAVDSEEIMKVPKHILAHQFVAGIAIYFGSEVRRRECRFILVRKFRPKFGRFVTLKMTEDNCVEDGATFEVSAFPTNDMKNPALLEVLMSPTPQKASEISLDGTPLGTAYGRTLSTHNKVEVERKNSKNAEIVNSIPQMNQFMTPPPPLINYAAFCAPGAVKDLLTNSPHINVPSQRTDGVTCTTLPSSRNVKSGPLPPAVGKSSFNLPPISMNVHKNSLVPSSIFGYDGNSDNDIIEVVQPMQFQPPPGNSFFANSGIPKQPNYGSHRDRFSSIGGFNNTGSFNRNPSGPSSRPTSRNPPIDRRANTSANTNRRSQSSSSNRRFARRSRSRSPQRRPGYRPKPDLKHHDDRSPSPHRRSNNRSSSSSSSSSSYSSDSKYSGDYRAGSSSIRNRVAGTSSIISTRDVPQTNPCARNTGVPASPKPSRWESPRKREKSPRKPSHSSTPRNQVDRRH